MAARSSARLQTVDWDEEAAEKSGYETFMLKEIHEQPTALADTLAERIGPDGQVVLDGLGLTPDSIKSLRQVIIVACGTSYHAGLVGKYALERWARVPVEVEVASEFRYRDPVIGPDCLCIAISQSGETADTLAAMRLARQAGAHVLAVTNIVGSQATREADGVLFTRAGLEIGVAATKTFLTQVLAMLLLALHLAETRGHLTREQVRAYTEELRHIPRLLGDYLDDGAAERVDEVARDYALSRFFMCLGRNVGLPVALEGALKLKEISYVPTDAYAAGEMKHGPIALLEEGSPVLVVATDSFVYDKLISNVQEVKARGARVIAVASAGNETLGEMADEVFYVPRTDEMLVPPSCGGPAAAVRLLRGQEQGREGRSTAQPGQDRHGGVARGHEGGGGVETRGGCGSIWWRSIVWRARSVAILVSSNVSSPRRRSTTAAAGGDRHCTSPAVSRPRKRLVNCWGAECCPGRRSRSAGAAGRPGVTLTGRTAELARSRGSG